MVRGTGWERNHVDQVVVHAASTRMLENVGLPQNTHASRRCESSTLTSEMGRLGRRGEVAN